MYSFFLFGREYTFVLSIKNRILNIIRKIRFMKKIECVIMDWAGTAIDYGCFAPVSAFLESFRAIGIEVTAEEARRPMGLTKIDHIRALFEMPRIGKCFEERYKRPYQEEDVQGRYEEFQRLLFSTLKEYTMPIAHVIEVVDQLRAQGIKIGSTTGYTREMMDVVIPAAADKGYHTDNCVTSDGLPAGRPYPYMIYRNMCDLAVPCRKSVLKYGDTISDIKEGVNAGVWTVGVIVGSNEMGLTEEEFMELDETERRKKMADVRNRMYAAGADYVVNDITELPALIDAINKRMN